MKCQNIDAERLHDFIHFMAARGERVNDISRELLISDAVSSCSEQLGCFALAAALIIRYFWTFSLKQLFG